MAEEITGDDMVEFVSASILSCPEDDIWDNVFDWIQNSTQQVITTLAGWINNAVSSITSSVSTIVSVATSGIRTLVNYIYTTVATVKGYVTNIYSTVYSLWSGFYTTVRTAVSSVISTVHSWIQSGTSTLTSWISAQSERIITWITSTTSAVTAGVQSFFAEWGPRITGWIDNWGENIAGFFSSQWKLISEFWSAWFKQRGDDLDAMQKWMLENVVAPIDTWWEGILAKLLDFPSWVGGLMDAVAGWFNVDIPGSSPRWTKIFEDIGQWFVTWFVKFPQYMADDFPAKAAFGLTESFKWVGEMFNSVFETFNSAMTNFAAQLGPMSPDMAMSNYGSIAQVGLLALGGLAGMTVAGEFLNPISHLGLGHVSAMVYDMTNYKLITGAFMAAFTYAALKQPLTYYYNAVFRPHLLEARDFMQLMSRRAFTQPATLRNPDLTSSVATLTGGNGQGYEMSVLGYYGYPDAYYGLFRELANTPLRYFPLAGIARTGFYDKEWYEEALARSGYSRTAKDALLVMYEKMTGEALQGSMSGAAVTRFKEGYSTEDQFIAEMELLGYSPQQADKYLTAARLDYATDYLTDMKTAYTDAAKKGHISLDEYRDALLDLGIVPDRVESFVLRTRIYLRPKEKPTVVSPPTPAYETDQGKIEVDTLRRQRRKNIITRDEELAGLLTLGMENAYAVAIADNDDVRLAEKAEEG